MKCIFGYLETINEDVQGLKRKSALGDNDSLCLPEGIVFPITSLESLNNLEILSNENNFKSVVSFFVSLHVFF